MVNFDAILTDEQKVLRRFHGQQEAEPRVFICMTPLNLEFMKQEMVTIADVETSAIANSMPQAIGILNFDELKKYGIGRNEIDLG